MTDDSMAIALAAIVVLLTIYEITWRINLEAKKRTGTVRESIIGKLLAAVIMSGFVLYVLPHFTLSFFSLVVIFLATTVISISVSKYLADKNSGLMVLMPAVLAFVATLLLFTVSPVKPP